MGEDQNENADLAADETADEATESGAESAASSWHWGTGRRKTSIARVRIRAGTGQVVVNKKPIEQYFTIERHRLKATSPLKTSKLEGAIDVFANCTGGGITGQADAMLMGLARALVEYDDALEPSMRQAGHLTRDARKVERKKYGRAGARRRFQYSKR